MGYSTDDSVATLPLVGPRYAEALERLGIQTIGNLLFHFPIRYQDTRDINSITELKSLAEGTVEATISSIANTRARTGRLMTRAQLSDSTGSISALWFNQPYLVKTFQTGSSYLFHGKVSAKFGRPVLMNPEYEKAGTGLLELLALDQSPEHAESPLPEGTTHLGRISPVYPETHGVSSRWLRGRIKMLRNHIETLVDDYLPDSERQKYTLMSLGQAVRNIHFPEEVEPLQQAQHRLGLDELVRIQLQVKRIQARRKGKRGIAIKQASRGQAANKIRQTLDFSLTDAQEHALNDIADDFAESTPMYRLLNGDVGSGKTIVALLAAAAVHEAGYSTIFMAPTTMLAQQHYQTITNFLRTAELSIPVVLLTSGVKADFPATPFIAVGTHALIHRTTLPEKIAFVIVDEQHRFGVTQREKLLQLTSPDATITPHYLTMTATPIPRTLTMALYGTTNVSILDDMPVGRIPAITRLVTERKRPAAYSWITDRIIAGDQVFVICPLIEESDAIEAKAAIDEFSLLKPLFPQARLGIVHGQMNEAEKNEVIEDFRQKKYDLLVATPVIEVGIDIPNATIMLIESAERFGLAQLHQLRGRIGRGDKQSYCLLFTDHPSRDASDRLKFFSTHTSGFDVAEYDLKRRGPGEVYGVRQSGLLNLRFADITDLRHLKRAQDIAQTLEINSDQVAPWTATNS